MTWSYKISALLDIQQNLAGRQTCAAVILKQTQQNFEKTIAREYEYTFFLCSKTILEFDEHWKEERDDIIAFVLILKWIELCFVSLSRLRPYFPDWILLFKVWITYAASIPV